MLIQKGTDVLKNDSKRCFKRIRQRFEEEGDGERMTLSRQLELASRKGFVSSCKSFVLSGGYLCL